MAVALAEMTPQTNIAARISESAATAPGWTNREPAFWPEWVEKVDHQQAA